MRSWIVALSAGTLLVVVIAFLAWRPARPTSSNTGSWSDASSILEDPSAFPSVATSSPLVLFSPPEHSARAEATSSIRFDTATLSPPTVTTAPFGELLKGLFTGTAGQHATSSSIEDDPLIRNLYAFMPQGTVAISAPPTRTPAQEALHAYGNAAGVIIQAYENTHTDQIDTLSAQASDRGNSAKADAIRAIAADIKKIGDDFLALSNVPENAQAANSALGKSYVKAGELLAAIADAGVSDKNTLSAINAYNAAADELTRNYVALVSLFALSEVTFSTGEPGSVFVFPGSSSY